MEETMTKLQKDDLMILLESMDSKMQITAETVCSMSDKIDGVEERINARIDHVDSILRVTVDEVAALHKKVDAVDKKVDAVYEELLAHRNDTELHKSQTKRSLKRVA
jgi:tetrahydromethanopterin S-methyltransferase subunit G